MISPMHRDNDIEHIKDQLKIYFKNTDFYEEEITRLHRTYHESKDSTIKAQLLEANNRYNKLVRDGKLYLEKLQYTHPELFKENITEFKIREGWYDAYLHLDDDSEIL